MDSSRQLDLFADLNLGPSDDEAGESEVVREGVGTFASMVGQAIQPDPSTSMTISYPRSLLDPTGPESSSGKSNKKKGNKKKKKSKTEKLPKASKYADKCMYAELLEMHDPSSSAPWDRDGLPEDLESGWVAIAPVPVGKRCLAVTHQSSGMGGVGQCFIITVVRCTNIQDSPKYVSPHASFREIPSTSLSITSTAANGSGLYSRPGLENQRSRARSGCRAVERPRRGGLRE